MYSVTYDGGSSDLLRSALPLHRQHGVPATVAVAGASFFPGANGRRGAGSGERNVALDLDAIHELQRHGWRIACLGPIGAQTPAQPPGAPPDAQALADAVSGPVTLLMVETHDHYHGFTPAQVQAAGYLGVFTLADRLNYNHVDEDLWALGRAPLYTLEGEVLPHRLYDPYWRLHQARDAGGWLVDSARDVTDSPTVPERDVTPALLAERFSKVAEVGGVWHATPEDVLDYVLMRRAAHPRGFRATGQAITFTMEAPRIPERVQNRELTLTLATPLGWQRPQVSADGAPVEDVTAVGEDGIRFTLPVRDGQQVRIENARSA